jgi:ABC-type transport system involved in multi-copper enzyme maturation permease subunit
MTALAPYRSQAPAGADGFGSLLGSEWTKFRSVRGWVAGLFVAALVTVGFGALTASSSLCSDGPGPGQPVALACSAPIGPDGEVVTDQFYFVHQPLSGNGTLTVRLTSLTSPASEPWGKAGIIVKASTKPGSAYAAVMATGGHGVRFQYDYLHDVAGLPGAVSASAPRWLRLTRSGDTISGYDSADGTHWLLVGTASLPRLPATAQAGMFATAPMSNAGTPIHVGTAPTVTGTFDHVSLSGPSGGAAAGRWTGTDVGSTPMEASEDGDSPSGDGFTVTGHGDIAPGADVATQLGQTLIGGFGGLIAVVVVGAMFITAEYRRGLIRTTLAATPGRGRVLAAKAIVLGVVTFVAGLAATMITVPVAAHLLRANGNFIPPVSALTQFRVEAGTAAIFAVAAVLALAIGVIARRGAAAVSTAIVVIILPYVLAIASPALPVTAANWVLRVTPAAAFALQQTIPRYPLGDASYTPFNGYFPLSPWAGFAVLCAWAAAALVLAYVLIQRRDA